MEKHLDGSAIFLKLTEDLTANNVPMFNETLKEMLSGEDAHEELVLDLNHMENIDSVGVTFVINLYKTIKNDGKLFRVVGASSDVQSLFKLMRLDQFFDLKD